MQEKHKPHLPVQHEQLAPEEVLGTPEGVTVFAKWTGVVEHLARLEKVGA